MSPLVQRQRPKSSFNNGNGSANGAKRDDQHWSMLVFESLSAGATTVLVAIGIVITVVGVYTVIVWPLTFWDGAHSGLEQYASWGNLALWSLFGGGSLAGFWCFSGAAFKGKSKPKPASGAIKNKKRV